jgi:hypothetical protein
MNGQKFKTIALGALVLLITLGAARQAQAADAKTQYPSIPPLDQYLMDRGDATVLVLGSHGYETAVEGKNGFVCVVERGWMNPFDSPEFWSPKTRGPLCFTIRPLREPCCQSL